MVRALVPRYVNMLIEVIGYGIVVSLVFVGISFCGFSENESFEDNKFVANDSIHWGVQYFLRNCTSMNIKFDDKLNNKIY